MLFENITLTFRRRVKVASALSDCTTVKILIFGTDMFRQTVQTQIRLLLEERSDQGPHCLLYHLHHL